jgi:8-oxo-dGTP pyrophosphatase MutT (NUDIX family)
VLLVHRPRYRDWTFPKGKVEQGETDEQAAVREVEEETGLRCELGSELPSIEYTDLKLRHKTVRYWAMEATGDGRRPGGKRGRQRRVGAGVRSARATEPRPRP